MDPSPVGTPRTPARPLSWDWWVRDRAGNVVLGQWPNPPLWVWAAATVLSRTGLPGPDLTRELTGIGLGALLVWGVDELARGVNPFRRLLGAAVVGLVVGQLVAS